MVNDEANSGEGRSVIFEVMEGQCHDNHDRELVQCVKGELGEGVGIVNPVWGLQTHIE